MASDSNFQEHMFSLDFGSNPNPYLCFTNDMASHNATEQAVDSIFNTRGLHYLHDAQLLPVDRSNVGFNFNGNGNMLKTDTVTSQGTPDVANMLQVPIPSHHLSFETTSPETDDIQMQDAPVLYIRSNGPDEPTSDSLMASLTSPVRVRYATCQDWEQHRDLFTQLYRDENRTLKEVKSIMKERYGFNATDKMYKKRICDWQLHKNCKASEKKEILQCIETNRKLGADIGEPTVDGRTIKWHVLERYRKAKQRPSCPSPNEIDSPSAKRICLGRPLCSASISFSRIKDPQDYRNYENLLFRVDQYYAGNLEKDPHAAWHAWKRRSTFRRIKVVYTLQDSTYASTLNHPYDIFNRYVCAARLLTENHRAAWRMIQEGAEMVLPSLRQDSPMFLQEYLKYLAISPSKCLVGVRMQLPILISGMARVAYGDHHPMSDICRLLEILHSNQDVIDLTSRKFQDVLKRHLGETHQDSLNAQRSASSIMLEQRKYYEAERSLNDLISIYGRIYGKASYPSRHTLYVLATVYYKMHRDQETEDVLVDVLQRGSEQGESNEINVKAKQMQGSLKQFRGDYRAAEASFWSSLSGSLLGSGPRDPLTVRIWIKYQKAKALLQSQHQIQAALSCQPDKEPEISEKPLRCCLRIRSKSQPPMGRCR